MPRKDSPNSKRQRQILKFIGKRLDDQGYPPTIREIGNAVGITSTSVVNYHLNKLKDSGYIERDDRVSRGLKMSDKAVEEGWGGAAARQALAGAVAEAVAKAEAEARSRAEAALRAATEAVSNLLRVQVMGDIAAGRPIAPLPDPDPEDYIEVAADLVGAKSDVYALRVKGNSMIDALINDGDIVVMQAAQTADNGEMVAAWLVDEEETTLKRFFLEDEGRQVRLQPENVTMQPFYYDPKNVEIKGRVVAVIRRVGKEPLRRAG